MKNLVWHLIRRFEDWWIWKHPNKMFPIKFIRNILKRLKEWSR